MGGQQGRSIARATRGLRLPSLDARSLAQPCYLPEKIHWALKGESGKERRAEKFSVAPRSRGESPASHVDSPAPVDDEERKKKR